MALNPNAASFIPPDNIQSSTQSSASTGGQRIHNSGSGRAVTQSSGPHKQVNTDLRIIHNKAVTQSSGPYRQVKSDSHANYNKGTYQTTIQGHHSVQTASTPIGKELLGQLMLEFQDVISQNDIDKQLKLASRLFGYQQYQNSLRLYDRVIDIASSAKPQDYDSLKEAWYNKEKVYRRMGDPGGEQFCAKQLENLLSAMSTSSTTKDSSDVSLSTANVQSSDSVANQGDDVSEYSADNHQTIYRQFNIYSTECEEPAVLRNPPTEYASEGVVQYAVRKDFGELTKIAFISEQSLDFIIYRAEPEGWTRSMLSLFLSFRFVRSVEQGKVIYLRSKTEMKRFGISEHSLWFNSGLVDRDQEKEIWLCLVQYTQKSHSKGWLYMLLSDTVFLSSDEAVVHFMSLAQSAKFANAPPDDHTIVIGEMTRDFKLLPPTYIESRDQRIIFDPEATVTPNVEHIVKDRLDRLILSELVDPSEALIFPKTELTQYKQRYSNFLFVEYDSDHYIAKRTDGTFHFRRHTAGIMAAQKRLGDAIQFSIRRCRRSLSLVVPQFYYETTHHLTKNVHVRKGRLQLLLPLFDYKKKVTAALALEELEDERGMLVYNATTVIPLDWAYANARLITQPYVKWIEQRPEQSTTRNSDGT